MNKYMRPAGLLLIAGSMPLLSAAQIGSGYVQHLHGILENIYLEMVPLCQQLIDVARALAIFGALWYIGIRVSKHIAAAEPVDFFPLFRPFVLIGLIGLYPAVLGLMNGLLKPTVLATQQMVTDTYKGVHVSLDKRAEGIVNSEEWQAMIGDMGMGDYREWRKYEQPETQPRQEEGFSLGRAIRFALSLITNSFSYMVKWALSYILQVLYYAAALCIDTLRTFHLLILAILGPLVLCLSVYDGFQHSLSIWLGRYINVYLWLPISNIFGSLIGKIQQGMLRIDTEQMAQGHPPGFGETDLAYLIFLVIAIIGYTTIPSIANYVMHAAGGSALMQKVSGAVTMAATAATGGAAGAGAATTTTAASMASDAYGGSHHRQDMASAKTSAPYFDNESHQHKQISK